MSKNVKRVITTSIIVIVIIIAIISTFFIVRYFAKKTQIDNVCKFYSDSNVQERLENSTNDDLRLQIDGETIVGVIKIEKIGFEGLIYEGTTLATLDKGVGHYENSSYLNGNVCLAAHNSSKYWAKLYTLESGDKITYVSFLGTKEYEVNSITQISATDWSKLEKTNENILTLITCVKRIPTQRLCVQALEEK